MTCILHNSIKSRKLNTLETLEMYKHHKNVVSAKSSNRKKIFHLFTMIKPNIYNYEIRKIIRQFAGS